MASAILLLTSAFVVLVSSAVLKKRQVETDLDFPLTCDIRHFNFTVETTDANGKTCRSSIQTIGCYGSCETYETGSSSYPNRETERNVCLHDETRQKTVELDCDEGADQTIRSYTFPEAVTCICKVCNVDLVNCKTRTKRGTMLDFIAN